MGDLQALVEDFDQEWAGVRKLVCLANRGQEIGRPPALSQEVIKKLERAEDAWVRLMQNTGFRPIIANPSAFKG